MVGIVRLLVKWRLLWFILVAILFLSGCVRDDVAISFHDANHGQIVQHVRLKPQTGLRDTVAIAWLERLERQAQELGARVRHPSARPELIITMPFNNAKDLEAKFNGLLQGEAGANTLVKPRRTESSLLPSQLTIGTNNLLVMQRHRWQYDLDLRQVLADSIQPEELDLELSLETPWGAEVSANSLTPTIRRNGRLLIWALRPDQSNHLEATFWVPNFLGIGSVVIVAAVLAGLIAKVLMTPAEDIVSQMSERLGN